MTQYVLYGGGLTLGAGPQMVLDYLKIPYELKSIDILKNEQLQRSYLNINPAGFLPALVGKDGTVLHEAAAIMLYLADKYDSGGLSPKLDSSERALFLSRLWYLTNEIQPVQKIYFYPHRYSTDDNDAVRIQSQARKIAFKRWQVINDIYLENTNYFIANKPSIVDILMSVLASYGMETEHDVLDKFENVKLVYDRIAQTQCWGDLLIKLNKDIVVFSADRDKLEGFSK